MIEVTKSTQKKYEKNKIKSKKKSSFVNRNNNTFQTELEKNIYDKIDGSIDELLDDLKDQERRFLHNQTYSESIKYKSLIKKILQTVLENGIKTQTLKRNRKDRADFTILKMIDDKLLDISRAITTSNKAFDLLKSIEEIRGLIFDLIY